MEVDIYCNLLKFISIKTIGLLAHLKKGYQ
jgi:hypothetical protein